jgi:hypothetical protein
MAKDMLANSEELRCNFPAAAQTATIGIDLGDRYSHCCFLGSDGTVLSEGRVRTTPAAMANHFKDLPSTRIAIEVGAHSRWVSQLLQDWGHEVIVANPRNLPMITSSVRKSDIQLSGKNKRKHMKLLGIPSLAAMVEHTNKPS